MTMILKKYFRWGAAILILLSIALAGCAFSQNPADHAKIPSSSGQILRLASSLGDIKTQKLAQAFADQTGITVEIDQLPPGTWSRRLEYLQAHKDDIWLGGSGRELYLAERQHLLQVQHRNGMALFNEQLQDQGQHWLTLALDYPALLSNKSRLQELQLAAPEELDDLLQPVLYEEIILPDPHLSSASLGMITGFWQWQGRQRALEMAGKLRTQKPAYTATEAEAALQVYNGKKTTTVLPLSYARQLEREHPGELTAQPLSSGRQLLVTGAAWLAASSHVEAAESFLDFLVSPAGRQLLEREGLFPAVVETEPEPKGKDLTPAAPKKAEQVWTISYPEGILPEVRTDLAWQAVYQEQILTAWQQAY